MRLKLILFITLTFCSYSQDMLGHSYQLGKDDVLRMNVNLWGHVQRPGAYQIPVEYGLIELISGANGPSPTANLDDVRIVRKNNEVVFVDIRKYITVGDHSVLVQLRPGDTVIVGGSIADKVGTFLGYLRDIAIVLNVIVLAQRLN